MPMGSHGFLVPCAGCGRQFDSKGLRCCSADCERQYRERKDNAGIMAEVGMEPVSVKRKCENPGCGRPIPKWRNGKRVSSATRFCSKSCANKASKARTARITDLGAAGEKEAHSTGLPVAAQKSGPPPAEPARARGV
jgi:hypothetical protein